MNEIIKQLGEIGIVPVIKIDDAQQAVPLAKALAAGGINCAEITFRTDAAEEAIRLIAENCPDMLVGAGTVLNTETADRAIAAGAKFIVSPGIKASLVEHCQKKNVPIIPGCVTPTEVEIAIECGLDVVKFFPAEPAGGLAMIKAISAPYPQMKFMPTGGISTKNLTTYLAFNKIVACGGSFMVVDDLEQVTELSKQAIELVRSVRG